MSNTSKTDSWIDSYEDLEPQLTSTGPTSAAPDALEPIVVNTATARRLLGGIDDKTLRDWRNQGHLNGAWFKLGNRVMFYVAALHDAAKRLCDTSALTQHP